MLIYKFLQVPFFLIMSFTSSFDSLDQPREMEITISEIRKNSGNVVVEIYKDKSRWLQKPFKRLLVSSEEEVQTLSFSVPYGDYAVTVYQDINENGEADRNFIGIPNEPVGFGNNYKPFGKPKFEAALIEYSSIIQPEPIRLYKVF